MDIIEIKSLKITEVKILRYTRYLDNRGYFSETFRLTDIHANFFKSLKFLQINESFSKKGVVRGLHFQWNPYMGKLIRTIKGTMIDIALDIRLGSPTFGKALLYKLQTDESDEQNEWIWVPPGFAHGNFFTQDSYIEYLCTSEYSPKTEASISPLASDIDWSLADKILKSEFDKVVTSNNLISQKDKNGYSLSDWKLNPDSKNFEYANLQT